MRSRARMIAFIAVSFLAVPANAQYVLDLTKVLPAAKPPQTDDVSITVSSRTFEVTGGQTAVPLPLNAAVIWLNRSDYIVGSRIVYDVRLTNVGRDDFVMPWAPRDFASPANEDANISASIALVIVGRDGRERLMTAVALGGHRDRPETVCVLKSGESAVIRVPGWLQIGSAEAVESFTVEGQMQPFAVRLM